MSHSHINLQPADSVVEYHQFLRKAIIKLLLYAKKLENKNLKVLDVGLGRGELLRDIKETGFDSVGIDFDEKCVELGLQYAPCYQLDIYDVSQKFEKDSFDVVILSHILEHLENPKKALEEIKEVTKKWIIISVPNLSQITYLIFKKHFGYVNKTHLYGWNATHLKTFLEMSCQLKIEKWQADKVFIPNRLNFLNIFSIKKKLENEILPRKFPFLSHSLICLCRKII
ncbi:MAG: methyltransferase type 11 [uncultured bacterium]|nr:MAG: methyltransferase type 11 [uncultured bacterium]